LRNFEQGNSGKNNRILRNVTRFERDFRPVRGLNPSRFAIIVRADSQKRP
jgi:hypothetical protein